MKKTEDILKEACVAAGCTTVLITILVAVIGLFLSPAIEMWLWNGIVAPYFNAPEIPFWVMFAINWICSLLFRRGSINTNSKNKE